MKMKNVFEEDEILYMLVEDLDQMKYAMKEMKLKMKDM